MNTPSSDQSHFDPFAYRWFSVAGQLQVADKVLLIVEGAHADDVLPGEAGGHEIAERVRKRYADLYGYAAARWLELGVWENKPKDVTPEGDVIMGMGVRLVNQGPQGEPAEN